ncbi:uncharacterized protein DUF5050 [Ureibacillus xyleni]|uniref:Uncharacterized protein DUF5050 n=1 Tax=Ureibacillus xyleni TaxID=614648 RepID=A0A285SBI9_9BACL|nr:DUF5050 domain-containing protein [Ureibacillus xyleni]SOC03077.1 uncharacterized protein DUF5050 [Ureibacillus xyleni]
MKKKYIGALAIMVGVAGFVQPIQTEANTSNNISLTNNNKKADTKVVSSAYTEAEQSVINLKNFQSTYYDGWVYYSAYEPVAGTFKQRLDGSEKKRLFTATDFVIHDGWIYFIQKTNSGKSLNRMKLDGKDIELLDSGNASNLVLDTKGNLLYYSNKESSGVTVKKLDLKNLKKSYINKNMSINIYSIQLVGDILYFTDNAGYAYKLKTDGSGYEKLVLPDGIVVKNGGFSMTKGRTYRYLAVYNGYMYYCGDGNLYKYNYSTRELKQIYISPTKTYINKNETTSEKFLTDFILKGEKIYAVVDSTHVKNNIIQNKNKEVIEMDLNGENQKIISKEKYKVTSMVSRHGITILNNRLYYKFDDKFYELKRF